MKESIVKVEEIRHITHDVLQIKVEKPAMTVIEGQLAGSNIDKKNIVKEAV